MSDALSHRFRFNPEMLRTHIMTEEEFDPSRGDLFVPEDMLGILGERGPGGGLLGPVFRNKRMVLMGPMGVGKTCLFNRLTRSQNASARSLASCTKELAAEWAQGPASDLLVCDTPGTSNSDRASMKIEEAMELRKALVNGVVGQVVAVVAFPNVTRKAAFSDMLAGSVAGIFDCDTFKADACGRDVSLRRADLWSPRRTRAFLVVTHRDCAQMGREDFPRLVAELRAEFSWIGPVALVDQRVSLEWLYDTVVACAGYQARCCTQHTIPLVEMFLKFKMSFDPLREEEWEDLVDAGRHELTICMSLAIDKINEVVREREQMGPAGSGHVDRVTPTLDCITCFVDDMYEKVTADTLARCYGVPTDDLWESTDEHVNNERVNTWNAIKQLLAPTLAAVRKKIRDHYPTAGEAAVYKACTACGAVYTKPVGCDNVGQCGRLAVGTPKPGMDLRFKYEFDPVRRTLSIGPSMASRFELELWKIRRGIQRIVKEGSIFRRSETELELWSAHAAGAAAPAAAGLQYGCGAMLCWATMRSLSKDELLASGLVPEEVRYEPCKSAMSMPIEAFLKKCGGGTDTYLAYLPTFTANGVREVKDAVEGVSEDELRQFLDVLGIPFRPHKNLLFAELRKFLPQA